MGRLRRLGILAALLAAIAAYRNRSIAASEAELGLDGDGPATTSR